MVENIEKYSAAAIGRLIAAGTLDPIEVTEYFLDRIERGRDNATFVLVTGERARQEAMASWKRHREGCPAGPLDGVPVVWKDIIDMAGTRTSAGSVLFAQSPPKQKDAPIVANLAAAGLVADVGSRNRRRDAVSASANRSRAAAALRPSRK